MKNLWFGRFSKQMDEVTALYNESLSFDNVLYPYSILGSLAHVNMLKECKIIDEKTFEKIRPQ